MKHTFPGVLAGSFGLLLTAIPALAHHTIAAEFDARDTVTVTGVFTRIDWIKPHIYFYIDAKDDSGKVTDWQGELPSPNLLSRRGWSRSTLKPGDQVTVIGAPAKNGEKGMQVKKLVFPDGHELPGTVLPPDSSK